MRIRFLFPLALVPAILLLLSSCSPSTAARYDASYIERKLSLPYEIDGTLLQDGQSYDVKIRSADTGFTIEFLSGDVTKGLTVEFFDNGVFLFFDDLRFKTNSQAFVNLEALKKAFELLGSADVVKHEAEAAQTDGSNVASITADTDTGGVKILVNKNDGSILRLQTSLSGVSLSLEFKSFENVQPASGSTGGLSTVPIYPSVPAGPAPSAAAVW